MKKNIIIAGIALLLFGGIVIAARPGGEPPKAPEGNLPGALTAAVIDSHDFGAISMARGNVSKEFTIENSSEHPVTITRMYTSCMCTEATLMMNGKQFGPYGMVGHGFIPTIKETIPAGGTATVSVVFDPAAHGPAGVGRIERAVRIESENAAPLTLEISATVTP